MLPRSSYKYLTFSFHFPALITLLTHSSVYFLSGLSVAGERLCVDLSLQLSLEV